MNCKQGDLAVIVRSAAGNEGKIVEIIKLLGADFLYGGRLWNDPRSVSWLVMTKGLPIKDNTGHSYVAAPVMDKYLRPIRPGELDETTDTDLKLKEPA